MWIALEQIEVIVIKKKVLFGITSLGLGGAERVLVDISNKLSEKYDVTIFSIYDHGELQKELNDSVKFKSIYNCNYRELNTIQRMWSPIRILFLAKSIYKKYIKKDYDVDNDIKRVFGTGIKSKIKKNIDKKYTKNMII